MAAKLLYDGYVKVESVRKKEVVRVTDSVGFLAIDSRRKIAILVSQERDPMITKKNPKGMMLEVSAGRFDIKVGVKGLIKKEALEELGLTIQDRDIRLLNGGKPLALSPGVLTEQMYIAFFDVDLGERLQDPSGRVFGVEADEERITHRIFTFKQLKRMKFGDMKTLAIVREYFKHRKEQKHKAKKKKRGKGK